MFQRNFKLAGVTAEDAQENIKKFGCKDIGSFALVREPDNLHDPNAIRVELGGLYLGYVPRDTAKDLAPEMDKGKRFIALFVNRNEHPLHDTVGLTVKIVKYPYEAAALELGRKNNVIKKAKEAITMKKFECKNGCSGEEGFYFEGNLWCSGRADRNGNTYDGDNARFVEVIYYCCEECGGEWNVGKDEEFYV